MGTSPTIVIDLSSAVPTYRQIADSMRAALVTGHFDPGAQLPTVRQLAMDLGVHHNTVAEAYRMLAEEGWLELNRRRGATVLQRTARAATAEVCARFSRRLRELVAEARADGVPAETIRDELLAMTDKKGPKGTKR